MNHRAPWLVLDADAALAAVLADAVGELHAGVSGLIQIRSADDATRQALATICTVAERHGTRVVRWPSTDPMPWHELDVLMGAAAGQGTAVLVVAEELDRRSRSDRAGLTGAALRSLRRADRLQLVLGPHDAGTRRRALDGTVELHRPGLLVVATVDAPVTATMPVDEEDDPTTVAERRDVDEWVGALQPAPALRSAVAALDEAAGLGPSATAAALEGLALAQALYGRDRAASAALALASTAGAPATDRALAAAQVAALRAVLRLDASELRRAVAARHDALIVAREVAAIGPGDVPMLDGITGLAAVLGVAPDAAARAPIGPVDATLLALADRLGPSATRRVPSGVGDESSELRAACATAWSVLSRSDLGIAWWHVALLACWPQARAAGWDETGDLLRAAQAFFSTQGFTALAAEARAALRAQGERVPRQGRGSSIVPAVLARCGVTSREVDVLAQLAGGATNKDVAAALFVSTGTVKHHVANLLRKTGLANRRELAALARELDLGAAAPPMLR